jgi:hypothetical protein
LFENYWRLIERFKQDGVKLTDIDLKITDASFEMNKQGSVTATVTPEAVATPAAPAAPAAPAPTEPEPGIPAKRGRGRPPKSASTATAQKANGGDKDKDKADDMLGEPDPLSDDEDLSEFGLAQPSMSAGEAREAALSLARKMVKDHRAALAPIYTVMKVTRLPDVSEAQGYELYKLVVAAAERVGFRA